MNLYQVKNNFSNYRLSKYLVIAENSSEAVSKAGLELKAYALETNYSCNEKLYGLVGIEVADIFDHIDKPDYYDFFECECIIEDIENNKITKV